MVERARDFKLSIGSAILFLTIGPDPIESLVGLRNARVRRSARIQMAERHRSISTVSGTVRMRINTISVHHLGSQKEQSNTARRSKDCTVVKDSRMADPIPKQTGNDACHEL